METKTDELREAVHPFLILQTFLFLFLAFGKPVNTLHILMLFRNHKSNVLVVPNLVVCVTSLSL